MDLQIVKVVTPQISSHLILVSLSLVVLSLDFYNYTTGICISIVYFSKKKRICIRYLLSNICLNTHDCKITSAEQNDVIMFTKSSDEHKLGFCHPNYCARQNKRAAHFAMIQIKQDNLH